MVFSVTGQLLVISHGHVADITERPPCFSDRDHGGHRGHRGHAGKLGGWRGRRVSHPLVGDVGHDLVYCKRMKGEWIKIGVLNSHKHIFF